MSQQPNLSVDTTPKSKNRQSLRQTISTLLIIILLFLAVRLTIQQFHIQGPSMEPTLHDQEYVIVNKGAYLLQPPARGDVIVFQYPLNTQENYVKRIIAIPGDIISIQDQTVSVNGVTIHEPYINKDDPYNPYSSFQNHIVGPDDYFVMGDNRGDSSDSRQWGLVPRTDVIGKAIVVYWPLGANNFGLLPGEDNVFAGIHQ